MSAFGTEFKLNIHVEPIDGLHMSEYDFEVSVFVFTNKIAVIPKSKMKKVDDDNYLVMITSDIGKQIGRGAVKMKFTAHIPDADFDDGFRTEVEELCTGIITV